MADETELKALLEDARLKDIHSFRCIIQLAHSAINKVPKSRRIQPNRKGVQLTAELEDYLDKLQRCATCYTYDDKNEIYIQVIRRAKILFNYYGKYSPKSEFISIFLASEASLHSPRSEGNFNKNIKRL